MAKRYRCIVLILAVTLISSKAMSQIRIATFNVSMDASNYLAVSGELDPNILQKLLAEGDYPQIRNVAEIIQRVRPDILLLNEFDYIADPRQGAEAFIRNYLNIGQGGAEAIDYPYYFVAPSNTGIASPFDLDRDGKATGTAGDAWGFGNYPGQYGMLVLSKWPIERDSVRTFQNFLWKDMPGAKRPLDPATGESWYSQQAWQALPLSSKSHWDISIDIDGKLLHFLVAHPTPPVFDGEEDRNGKRNHDEIRFWADYIEADSAQYIYDDLGQTGGLKSGSRFVIAGDLNASAYEGDSEAGAVEQLLDHRLTNTDIRPLRLDADSLSVEQQGGNMPYHTAAWRAQVDYVLPSRLGIKLLDARVFWPEQGSELFRLIESREASSDHRMVWIDIELTE